MEYVGQESQFATGSPLVSTTARLILCERQRTWLGAFCQSLRDADIRGGDRLLRETRRLDQCAEMLGRWPASFVALEVDEKNFAEVLDWLRWLDGRFPQALAVALCRAWPRLPAWVLREAGAVHVVRSVRDAAVAVAVAGRHFAGLPRAKQTVVEQILAELPWGERRVL